MNRIEIPPKSKESLEPIEFAKRAEELFVVAVQQESEASESIEETSDEKVDLVQQTAGQSPEQVQKIVTQGAMDQVFEWSKGAQDWWSDEETTNIERTGAVIGAVAVVAAIGWAITQAVKGLNKLGNWLSKKLGVSKGKLVISVVAAGLGIAGYKSVTDFVKPSDLMSAYDKDGWDGVKNIIILKAAEKMGKEKWEELQQNFPIDLPDYQEALEMKDEIAEKAREALDKVKESVGGGALGTIVKEVGGEDGFIKKSTKDTKKEMEELSGAAQESAGKFIDKTKDNFEDIDLSDVTDERIKDFAEDPNASTFESLAASLVEDGGEFVIEEGRMFVGMVGGFLFDFQKFVAYRYYHSWKNSAQAAVSDVETPIGAFLVQYFKEAPKYMLLFVTVDQVMNFFRTSKGLHPFKISHGIRDGLLWGVKVPMRMWQAGKLVPVVWRAGKKIIQNVDSFRALPGGVIEFFRGDKVVVKLNVDTGKVQIWGNGKFETLDEKVHPKDVLKLSQGRPVKLDEGRYLFRGVEHYLDESYLDEIEKKTGRVRVEIIQEICETNATSVGEGKIKTPRASVSETPAKPPSAKKIVSETLEEGGESVKGHLPEIEKILKELDIDKKKVASIMAELEKPHWIKAIAGFGEFVGHAAMPAFIAYMAYDLRFGEGEHDPQGTVATHLGFIAAFKLGAAGLKKGGSAKQKLLWGLAGVATPLLGAIGVQIDSVENWVNDLMGMGQFGKVFWNQSENALGVSEFYLANRLLFTGAIGKVLGHNIDKAIRPLMGVALKSTMIQRIRTVFLKEGIKKLATKMGLVLATRGASATAVNAIPVAGQVASVALWLWTAWEVGGIGLAYYKAQKVAGLFDLQGEKDVASISLDEVGARAIADQFNAYKVQTPMKDLEFDKLPSDIKNEFILQYYQELADCEISIRRTDGSSEISHWENGNVKYLKIEVDGEIQELTEEELNTDAAETMPPKQYIPTDIPYADIEAQKGGDALLVDYYNLEFSALRNKTEWSKLDPEVIDTKTIRIARTGMGFDTLIMEREGDQWKLFSEKNEIIFGEGYSFHSALAHGGMLLHSIGFLYDQVHVKKEESWRSVDSSKNPFYISGKAVKYGKDDALDRTVYGREWVDFYTNNLQLDRNDMAADLNRYFAVHAEALELIGD